MCNQFQIFESMEPSSYTSITLYNIGAITMERSATVGTTGIEQQEAEYFLHKAAEHWTYQQLNTSARVLPRVDNRLISLYLQSSPNKAPDLNVTVSQENLSRASNVIRRFENLYPHCSKWMESTFCLGKTDYCIRCRDIDGGTVVTNEYTIVSVIVVLYHRHCVTSIITLSHIPILILSAILIVSLKVILPSSSSPSSSSS